MDIHALPGDGNFILALGGVDSLITLMLLRPTEEAVISTFLINTDRWRPE